jgi:hypothetical protein
MHRRDFVEIAPGYCRTVYIPLCENCKKKDQIFNISDIKKFTSGDYFTSVKSVK